MVYIRRGSVVRLRQLASGWLVGQDIVRLEACGRPFVEGGQAMMAAAVEAADSDWWSAEL